MKVSTSSQRRRMSCESDSSSFGGECCSGSFVSSSLQSAKSLDSLIWSQQSGGQRPFLHRDCWVRPKGYRTLNNCEDDGNTSRTTSYWSLSRTRPPSPGSSSYCTSSNEPMTDRGSLLNRILSCCLYGGGIHGRSDLPKSPPYNKSAAGPTNTEWMSESSWSSTDRSSTFYSSSSTGSLNELLRQRQQQQAHGHRGAANLIAKVPNKRYIQNSLFSLLFSMIDGYFPAETTCEEF